MKHPFYAKSNWEPPVQQSVTLETYLEETKIKLSEIEITEPKPNLPKSERKAIKELKENSEINIKRADKGTTTVIMNRTSKSNTPNLSRIVRKRRRFDSPEVRS